MTITAATTIVSVRDLIGDPYSERWTDADLLKWITDGLREMATIRPAIFGASGTELSHVLAAGCKQRLTAANAFQIVSVDYNVASGKAIRLITGSQLDAFRPGWRADIAADVQNWFPDGEDQLSFWVYPAVAGATVSVHAHITPAAVTTTAAVVLPYDQYAPVLVNYVCFRAFSRDVEYGGNQAAAQAYYALFTAALKG